MFLVTSETLAACCLNKIIDLISWSLAIDQIVSKRHWIVGTGLPQQSIRGGLHDSHLGDLEVHVPVSPDYRGH